MKKKSENGTCIPVRLIRVPVPGFASSSSLLRRDDKPGELFAKYRGYNEVVPQHIYPYRGRKTANLP